MLCQFNINVLPKEHGVIIIIIAIIIIIIAHVCIGLYGTQSIFYHCDLAEASSLLHKAGI